LRRTPEISRGTALFNTGVGSLARGRKGAITGAAFASLIVGGLVMSSDSSRGFVGSALADPLSVLAGRSPGERSSGVLLQTKNAAPRPTRVASRGPRPAPAEKVLSAARPAAPAAAPAASPLPEASPEVVQTVALDPPSVGSGDYVTGSIIGGGDPQLGAGPSVGGGGGSVNYEPWS
jgi:hypothetical protein